MDKKQRNKIWSFLTDRQIWCNILILVIGFALTVVYTKVTINREISLMSRNSGLKGKIRSLHKRHANAGNDADPPGRDRNWIEGMTESEFLGAHLTAARGVNVRIPGNFQSPLRGDYFRWTSSGSNSFASLEINDEPEGTMIYIHKPGFYFVYSQIRYNGYGLYPAGHKTVKISQHIETSLMTSITTQQLASAGTRQNFATKTPDSGYHAGVFYFAAGDKLAVKPLTYQRRYTVGDDASFFGLYFLHN